MQKFKFRYLKKDSAVASVYGYALTIGICTMLLTSSTYMMTTYLERRIESAASLEAQSIANRLVGIIIELRNIKTLIPTANYTRTMKLPDTIGNYPYYIEATDTTIYVNSTNGKIKEESTTYKVMEGLNVVSGIAGRVKSGNDITVGIGSK